MIIVVKGLLNKVFDTYSAWYSTPSLCSESVFNGNGAGTDSSPHIINEINFMNDSDELLAIFLNMLKRFLLE